MYRWYVILVAIILMVALSGCKNEELETANQQISEKNKLISQMEGELTEANQSLKVYKQTNQNLTITIDNLNAEIQSLKNEAVKSRDRDIFAWASYRRVRDDFVTSLTTNNSTMKFLRRKQVMIAQELLTSQQAFEELVQDYVSITIWQNSVIPWYKYYRDMNDRSGASKFLGLGKAKKPQAPEPII